MYHLFLSVLSIVFFMLIIKVILYYVCVAKEIFKEILKIDRKWSLFFALKCIINDRSPTWKDKVPTWKEERHMRKIKLSFRMSLILLYRMYSVPFKQLNVKKIVPEQLHYSLAPGAKTVRDFQFPI
uniref:Uncharacterized protein n=1 Tax=Cacopsylla melanoneura TaxID=428564 RepID=A0A8D9F348_9HEMI